MTRNETDITKWLPLESKEDEQLYSNLLKFRIDAERMFERFADFLNELRSKNISKLHFSVPDNENLLKVF